MGKRGPAGKPQEIKELEGNPGKRRLNPELPRPEGCPRPPDHLGEYARRVWDQILASMPDSLYTQADQETLAAYCVAAEAHKNAATMVSAGLLTVVTPKGEERPSAWLRIMNDQARIMATLGSRLGLDPSARNSLQMKVDGDAPVSKFDGLVSIEGGRK